MDVLCLICLLHIFYFKMKYFIFSSVQSYMNSLYEFWLFLYH
jgi:hypothetical protein